MSVLWHLYLLASLVVFLIFILQESDLRSYQACVQINKNTRLKRYLFSFSPRWSWLERIFKKNFVSFLTFISQQQHRSSLRTEYFGGSLEENLLVYHIKTR